MPGSDDLFPFPPSPEEEGKKPSPGLPSFPVSPPAMTPVGPVLGAAVAPVSIPPAGLAGSSPAAVTVPTPGGAALSPEEVEDLRALVHLFGPRWLRRLSPESRPGAGLAGFGPPFGNGGASFPAGGGPGEPLTEATAVPAGWFPPPAASPQSAAPLAAGPMADLEKTMRHRLLQWFDGLFLEGVERESGRAFRQLLEGVQPFSAFLCCTQALTAAFPAAQSLRFGTPEQKQFALSALTDRCLALLSGVSFPDRPRFLKALAAWASAVSGHHTFLSGEQEPFSNQHWERVPGANPGGTVIREVLGLLVIRSDTRQIVRLGRAMT